MKCEGDCLKQGKGSFTCTNEANFFITHKLDAWSRDLGIDFTLKDS